MGLTQRESIALFRSKASSSGYISDDDRFPARRILSELKTVINVIKRRRLKKKEVPSPHDIITLDCVEMEEVPVSDCPTLPSSGLTWMKSVEPIPRYIKLVEVITIVGNTPVSVIDWSKVRARTSSRNKAIREKAVATMRIKGDKVYLYVLNSSIEAFSIVIVPEDFAEAAIFPRCGEVNQGLVCNPLDIEIGADMATLDEAIDLVIRRELSVNIAPDQLNNDNQG